MESVMLIITLRKADLAEQRRAQTEIQTAIECFAVCLVR